MTSVEEAVSTMREALGDNIRLAMDCREKERLARKDAIFWMCIANIYKLRSRYYQEVAEELSQGKMASQIENWLMGKEILRVANRSTARGSLTKLNGIDGEITSDMVAEIVQMIRQHEIADGLPEICGIFGAKGTIPEVFRGDKSRSRIWRSLPEVTAVFSFVEK